MRFLVYEENRRGVFGVQMALLSFEVLVSRSHCILSIYETESNYVPVHFVRQGFITKLDCETSLEESSVGNL